MHPGADGVKREVITNEDLDQGPYTLRTGFSHMELPRPHKILQPVGFQRVPCTLSRCTSPTISWNHHLEAAVDTANSFRS